MCFSAQASFTSSVVLTAIGVASLTKVKKPAQVLFGVIPLIFGIQQAAEGVLWVTLKSGLHTGWQSAGMYLFLITALIIWPTMIPLSTWMLEKDKKRRKFLAVLVVIGGIVSLFYVYGLIFHSAAARIESFHIVYNVDLPGTLIKYVFMLYLVATIVPLFVSTVKRMWLFGVLIGVSCIVTGVFFAEYLTSVWCFFAAVISIAIYWVLREMNKQPEQQKAI
jgi:hypothetical protein